MRKALVALYLLVLLFSCKKTVVEEVEGDSFRISILPVQMLGFDQYKFSGSLDLRHTADHVEYGLLVSKSVNPTLENGMKFAIGQSQGSIDFVKEVTGLDTGAVYYVRAYASSKTSIQYSSNQTIGKVSPSIYAANTDLNFGRPITIICNLPKLNANSSVKVFLNETPIVITSMSNGIAETVITAEIPDQLTPGTYTLSLSVNNMKISSKAPMKLYEGRWDKIDGPQGRQLWLGQPSDFFVSNDWIYTNTFVYTSSGYYAAFLKYNYKTKEAVRLKHFDGISGLAEASFVQQGNLLHFLCGNSDVWETKGHYVYNTTADSWTREADFPGRARQAAVSILANNKIYFGMGYSPYRLAQKDLEAFVDMWSYDLSTKVWAKQSPFPQTGGKVHNGSFTIGTKLYVVSGTSGTPVDGSENPPGETWCYDTTTDKWSRKADYPGSGAINLSSFAIGNIGYAGMGEERTYNSYEGRAGAGDFYKYEPEKDKWTEISHLPVAVYSPASGTSNNTALVVGTNDSHSYPTFDLFVFKPQK